MESRHELTHQFTASKSPSKSIKCLERVNWLASLSHSSLGLLLKRAAGFMFKYTAWMVKNVKKLKNNSSIGIYFPLTPRNHIKLYLLYLGRSEKAILKVLEVFTNFQENLLTKRDLINLCNFWDNFSLNVAFLNKSFWKLPFSENKWHIQYVQLMILRMGVCWISHCETIYLKV